MHLQPLFSKTLFFIFLIFALSCNNKKTGLEEYGTVFQAVILSDNGIFRTFSLGNAINEIIEKETNQPTEQDISYLYYEYKIDSGIKFNIKYTFDEKGLNEIGLDIFITEDTTLVEQTYADFKKYFNEHYGQCKTQRGFSVWAIKSDLYGEVIINLGSELPNFEKPDSTSKISLWIYPNNY